MIDIDIQQHLPEDFNDNARVWVYQSSRLFLISEALEMEDLFKNFTATWQSHGTPVRGYANLFFGRFIVLMADETASTVSGCSTDSSVRLIKEIEKKYNTDMFNRQLLNFIIKGKIEQLPLSQLSYAIENGFIDEHTLYFNNTIGSKKELVAQWIVPAGQTWLKNRFQPVK